MLRQDDRDLRVKILALSQSEAKGLGIGKNTLHYLREKATGEASFKVYGNADRRLKTVSSSLT